MNYDMQQLPACLRMLLAACSIHNVGMRHSDSWRCSESARGDDSGLLVLGDGDTLRALPESADGVAATQGLPPLFEDLLNTFVAEAMRRLHGILPEKAAVLAGEPIPLDALCRLLRQRLTGLLTQAVASLCERIEQPTAAQMEAAIAAEFPALLPLLRSTVAEWIAAVALFLDRLHRDAGCIAAAEHLPALPPIESLIPASSDVHAGGHPVLRVGFAGGACWYYKPRAVTGEWLWAELLDVLASHGLMLPRARVLVPGGRFHYGWMESLEPAAQQVSPDLYWHAAGALVCAAQHLRMRDLHLGNIVATPTGPAVVDAECLASPALPRARGAPQEPPLRAAMYAMLATGLLPLRSSDGEPDVSGLFGRSAPVRGITLPRWRVSPQGRWRMQPVAAALAPHPNAPAQASPVAVLPRLLAGYRHAAETLMEARGALLAGNAGWRRMLEQAHAPRVLIRDTVTYGQLLSTSLQPELLRSAARRRSAILCSLKEQRSDPPPPLLRMEAHALLGGYLPRFVQSPGSRTLATSSGRPVVRGFAAAAGAGAVIADMGALSRTRLEQLLIPALLASIW